MTKIQNMSVPVIHKTTLVLFAVGLLTLGGCTTRGSAQNAMAERAQMQNALAKHESGTQPADVDNRVTYLRVVTQMQQKGLYFASLAHIDALQQRWGNDPESNLLRADAMRQTGQPDAARSLYSQLLATPMKARAAHGLGLLAGRVGDLPGAVEYFLQASQAAPTDAAILNDLGYVLMQQGKWTEARVPLMKASELGSDNPRVWSNVALYLTLDGQNAHARSVMDSHQLSAASRTQIAELARAIQLRYQQSAVSAAPAVAMPPVVAQPPLASTSIVRTAPTAVTTPVLLPQMGTSELSSLPVPAVPRPVSAQGPTRVAIQ